jgi:hypothetical protein
MRQPDCHIKKSKPYIIGTAFNYDMRFSFVPRINIRSQIDSLLK